VIDGSINNKLSVYASNFIQPPEHLKSKPLETEGVNKIRSDLKLLGFRRIPHGNTMRQKSYELSKTAVFSSTFNTNLKEEFNYSFDNGYKNHLSTVSKMNDRSSKESPLITLKEHNLKQTESTF
jgi:hypothetical protein